MVITVWDEQNIPKNFKFLSYIKFVMKIFKCFSLIIMCYQLIDITIDYFEYPFDVTIDVNNNNEFSLPSITICTLNKYIWMRSAMNQFSLEINDKLKVFENEMQNVCNYTDDYDSNKCK